MFWGGKNWEEESYYRCIQSVFTTLTVTCETHIYSLIANVSGGKTFCFNNEKLQGYFPQVERDSKCLRSIPLLSPYTVVLYKLTSPLSGRGTHTSDPQVPDRFQGLCGTSWVALASGLGGAPGVRTRALSQASALASTCALLMKRRAGLPDVSDKYIFILLSY